MNTNELQKDAQKIWNIGYSYEIRDPKLDRITRFALSCETFDELMERLLIEFPVWNINRQRYINYACARWYNYRSAMYAESVFNSLPYVQKATEEEDRNQIDFYIEGVPFDLKNVLFPKNWRKSFDYGLRHKRELINWLYFHQSHKARQSFKNKIYITFHSSYRPTWMMKAEFWKIRKGILNWMRHYKLKNMTVQLDNDRGTVRSDVIFITE